MAKKKPAAKGTSTSSSGIQELVWVDPKTLTPNPLNWRKHPAHQKRALKASIESNGWSGTCLFNKRTGKLIDGHARREYALEHGITSVPVLVGEWSEEQERNLLATYDPISAMAEADTEMLRQLTASFEKDIAASTNLAEENMEAMSEMATNLVDYIDDIESGAPAALLGPYAEAESAGIEPSKREYVETEGIVRLKSRSEIGWDAWGEKGIFEFPLIRSDMLADPPDPIITWIGERDTEECANYLYIWGSNAIRGIDPKDVVVGFYTEDHRFEPVWDSPETYVTKLQTQNIQRIISPNFSCYVGTHYAYDIFQTYRARWLSRYFQEAGLKVIPDLMLGNLRGDVWKWRFAGIPVNAPCVAFEAQNVGDIDIDRIYRTTRQNLEKAVELLKPQSLLIYTGKNLPGWLLEGLPKTLHVTIVKSFMNERQRFLNNSQSLTNTSGIRKTKR